MRTRQESDRDRRRGWQTAAVAILLVSSVLACGVSPGPTPVIPTAPLATPVGVAPTGISVLPPCSIEDLEASHGRVEGAAGSRFTTVVLIAAIACSVAASPAFGLRDATHAILLGSAAAGPGRIDLVAGAGYETAVRLGNWCAAQPAFPLDLAIRLGSDEVSVTGPPFANDGDLPPCNGTAGPILEAGPWATSP